MAIPGESGSDLVLCLRVPVHTKGAGPCDAKISTANTGPDDDTANHMPDWGSRRLHLKEFLIKLIYL
jgi:hypothetical protein